MSERGMKKYVPFKSLNEQESFLNQMMYEKNKKPMRTLAEDEAAELNNKITDLKRGEIITITYYKNGYEHTITDTFITIDIVYNKLVFQEHKIDISNVLNIEK